ncbi:MAG: dihydroorotate dehydrogenase [Lentisphaerae bacterium]|nr:dihydroorotate dehydrogenase [Lentisphaerota bacterium]
MKSVSSVGPGVPVEGSPGPDLAVDIGGIRMKNPVMVASGTFGYGPEYADVVDLNRLGALVVKGISLEPWEGNATPRMVEVPGGLVNAIGLQNPGVAGFVDEYLPFLRNFDVPVIVNIWGRTVEEYAGVARALDAVEGVAGIEVNISCPNIKEGGISFGTDPASAAGVVAAVRESTALPLIPKLPPNVPDIGVIARAVEEAGADAVSLINTIPAMVIDVETRRPVLANTVGGLSGPAIHAVAVKQVWETAGAVGIPVVGMGGVTGPAEALEFIIAGATAVAVGTASFADPCTATRVIEGISDYLRDHGIDGVASLTGTLEI